MSMLTEKRQEIAARLEELEKARFEVIKEKLDIYRAKLEAEAETDEIRKTRATLEAIDAVIRYDVEANSAKAVEETVEAPVEETPIVEEAPVEAEPVVEEIPAEEVKIVAETENDKIVIDVKEEADTVVAKPQAEPRPGMAYVGIPERR